MRWGVGCNLSGTWAGEVDWTKVGLEYMCEMASDGVGE